MQPEQPSAPAPQPPQVPQPAQQPPQPAPVAPQPNLSTTKKVVIIIVAIVLAILGGQGIYAEITSDVIDFSNFFDIFTTIFNLALLLLGLALLKKYLLPKK